MRSERRHLLVAALAVWGAPELAQACDPGAIFSVVVVASDAPACLQVAPRRRVRVGSRGGADPKAVAALDLANGCAEAVTLEASRCDACGEKVSLGAGEQGTFVVESRPQGEVVDYGKHTKQALRWSVGTRSGALDTDVTVVDDLEACRGGGGDEPPKGLSRGCGCGVTGDGRGGWLAWLGLGVAVWRRRRWRVGS